MIYQNLDQLVQNIKVTNQVNADVEVVNNSQLVMLGKGRQGAVFQLTDDICVKVFGNMEDCDREHQALAMGANTNLFPKLYAKGPLYIAMEIIRGVDLREYLQSQPLTEALSAKLIEMLTTFKAIGYERIDHHKRQIYLQPDGSLKVIDVARTIWRDRVYPYPRKLLTSLGEENKAVFLSHVQAMAPELYQEWLHYIHMEELSRQITGILLPEKPDKQMVKKISKGLLTTEDDKNYVLLLEGLVHKVFKEEWVKTMLARGKDPEKVMEKIDEHWDNLEQAYEQANFNNNRIYEGDRNSKGDRDQKRSKRFEGDREKDKHRGKKSSFEGERYHRDRKNDKNKHSKKGKHR
jgi:predicted Ser/Thr protein kinase